MSKVPKSGLIEKLAIFSLTYANEKTVFFDEKIKITKIHPIVMNHDRLVAKS